MKPPCPGRGHCFALRGNRPCCAHGCRVCGGPILADCEDWPAPLCLVHAPEDLITFTLQLRAELERMLGYFDGAHQSDCKVWSAIGCLVYDAELARLIERAGVAFCTCGYFAIRQDTRARLGLIVVEPRRDTEPAPAPAGMLS